ncbi:MAG: biotin--[acetyl-CoA-carboxylase] ligase [Elusimicrobia bacterium]|nr:biotin--[acetyl-CoA-carboxylase] ligase [Elusimicrobiota bacterium]
MTTSSPFPGIRRLHKVRSTTSTQDLARQLAEAGAEDGTLVWALRQTAGRGRLDRRWHSAAGGLYVSLILRPPFPPSRLADFSLMTAEAAADALSRVAGIETAIKPPNDVMALPISKGLPAGTPGRSPSGVDRVPATGGPKKICGILAEARGGCLSIDWLVVGIGVNVNNTPAVDRAGLPAASLKSLTGKTRPLASVLKALLAEFQVRYRGFL